MLCLNCFGEIPDRSRSCRLCGVNFEQWASGKSTGKAKGSGTGKAGKGDAKLAKKGRGAPAHPQRARDEDEDALEVRPRRSWKRRLAVLPGLAVVAWLGGWAAAPAIDRLAARGTLVYVSGQDRHVYAQAAGAAPVRLGRPVFETAPSVTRDGRRVAFLSEGDGSRGIDIVGADGSVLTRIPFGANAPREAQPQEPVWSPDGSRIAYATRPEMAGPSPYLMEKAIAMAQAEGLRVQARVIFGEGGPSLSSANGTPMGSLADWMRARGLVEYAERDIFVASADGKRVVNVSQDEQAYDRDPAWSPGGTKLAFAKSGGYGAAPGIYTVMADGSERALLNGTTDGHAPAWSPDGGRIAFIGREGALYVATVGSSEVRRVTDTAQGGGGFERVSWSPDGERLAAVRAGRYPLLELAIVRADGGGVEQVVSSESRSVAWTSADHLIFIGRPRAGRSWFSIREYSGEPQACLRSVHRGVRSWLAPFNDLTSWALTTIARTPPVDPATTVLTESGAVAVDWAPGSS